MRLYLLRSGKAEPGRGKSRDAHRALVGKGIRQVRQVAELMKRVEIKPLRLLSSPLARSVETSEIIKKIVGFSCRIELEPLLEPRSKPELAIEAALHRSPAVILVVTHDPLIGRVAAALTGAPTRALQTRRGGLLELEIQGQSPPKAILTGLLRPRFLRSDR